MQALPEPDSQAIMDLPLSYQAREIYRFLYDNRETPPTMREIRDALEA